MLSPDEQVAASAREHIWDAQVVPTWTRESIIQALRAQWRKTHVTLPIWRSLRLQPSVEIIAAEFGSWSAALEAASIHQGSAHRGRRCAVRGEVLPRQQFADWIERRVKALTLRGDLTGSERSLCKGPPAVQYLAKQLGISERVLQRYRYGARSVRREHPDDIYRGSVERMCDHMGISIYEIYPELEEMDDIPLEEDAYCPKCWATVTPIQGICPWCETIVRYLGEEAA